MNQGRIWCVVNPTVGLPLFLGAVAVTSLIVHFSVLSNTTWFASYWNGSQKAKTASVEKALPNVAGSSSNGAAGFVISVAPVAGKTSSAETSFVITVAPTPTAPAPADVVASVSPPRAPESLTLAAATVK